MTAQEIVNEVKKIFLGHADEERKTSTQRYFDTSLEIIGLSTPEYRHLWKEYYSGIPRLTPPQIIELGLLFIRSGYFEMQQLGIDLLGASKKNLQLLNTDTLETMISKIDNWACADNFGVNVLGKCWQLGIIDTAFIERLSEAEGLWERRLSLVATVPLNQKSSGGTGVPEITLALCEKRIFDREPLIVKALSWILRKLAVFYPDRVTDFIEQHKSDLHPQVIREVSRKIRTGKKN